jgi:hypothetical protein
MNCTAMLPLIGNVRPDQFPVRLVRSQLILTCCVVFSSHNKLAVRISISRDKPADVLRHVPCKIFLGKRPIKFNYLQLITYLIELFR